MYKRNIDKIGGTNLKIIINFHGVLISLRVDCKLMHLFTPICVRLCVWSEAELQSWGVKAVAVESISVLASVG